MAQSTNAYVATLPIADVVEEVRHALGQGNVLLHAEPGAGKSTGLPLTLLPSASPANKIVMLEPRRLAAIGVAERMAALLGEPLGQRVGLRMRGQTTVSAETILEVVTEGVLTRMLQADPLLESVGLVIFDEFHERSLHADLGLALCREVQTELRPDLRLLLMSATLEGDEITARLQPIQQINCEGRAYPVHAHWLGRSKSELPRRVASVVLSALADHPGDVLVFLPGVAEIEKAASVLESRLGADIALCELHGQVDSKSQRRATGPANPDQRRVILSTSIAETSLTIDGVRVVVDSGLERRGRVDSVTGAQQLETVQASQASATQRMGRAGRTASGVCYRLWPESEHATRARNWQPEILRAELSSLVLEVGQWGANDISSLPWLDPPPRASVARAELLLQRFGIWQEGRLTDYGMAVAKFPVHARLGHMLLWASEHGAAELGCKLAALLEDGGVRSTTCDLENLVRQGLPPHKKRRAQRFQKLLGMSSSSANAPGAGVLLAQAYPDWVAKRRPGDEARYQLSCGAGAYVVPQDPLAQSDWLVVADMGGTSREARVFLACELHVEELERWAPSLFATERRLEWDDRQERVVAESQKRLGELLVSAHVTTDVSDDERARALLMGIRRRGIDCLPWTDECREWQARVLLIAGLELTGKRARRAVGQDKNRQDDAGQNANEWPAVDDQSLIESLETWLLPWLAGVSSLKAIQRLNLHAILQSMLSYSQQQQLAEALPVRYQVPICGSMVKLRYANEETPVLSVILQEMFGRAENPSIAGGGLHLKVELLSPARRPVQITTDLANFWQNSYPAVKKDMAGRYPKHDWPDDPLRATPTAYAKPRNRQRRS